MKPTESHSLLQRVYYPARGDLGCSRQGGCMTARLPRPPDTTLRLVLRYPPPPHTPKATLQKGWAPQKTRSLDAPPAASADISGGGCTKPGASSRAAGAPKGSRPGASGRSPWGRGREGTGGRRPRGASAQRPSVSRLARHPAAGRARTPGRRSRGRLGRRRAESRAAPNPSASLTPHRGEGPDREAGRAARPVSLCHAVLPPTLSLSSSSPPPWSSGPLGSAGQKRYSTHAPHIAGTAASGRSVRRRFAKGKAPGPLPLLAGA